MNRTVSPSRTYVAMCNTSNFDGYRFKKFHLPEPHENDSARASWYFLNKLDYVACIEGCLTFEDYSNLNEIIG